MKLIAKENVVKQLTFCSVVVAQAVLLSMAACSDQSGTLRLNMKLAAMNATGGQPTGTLGADGLTIDDGTNVLVITSAEVAIEHVEFERAEATVDCDDAVDEDACEEFETAPMIVTLPLDGTVAKPITADVPVGTYDEIEFDIDDLGDEPADETLLTERPDFSSISVLVTGTFNGVPFTYSSDLDAEQEIELAEPLVISDDRTATTVTLTVDVAKWFVSEGMVLDPSTALDDGANEEIVEENIEASFEGADDDED